MSLKFILSANFNIKIGCQFINPLPASCNFYHSLIFFANILDPDLALKISGLIRVQIVCPVKIFFEKNNDFAKYQQRTKKA